MREAMGADAGDPDIAVWNLDHDDDIALAEAMSFLSGPECRRFDRFVFRRDAERFARSRGFLRRNIADRLGGDPAKLPLEAGEGEKPWLPGAEFDFNLSRSGDTAVLAFVSSGSVGIDLEMIDRRTLPVEETGNLAWTCMGSAEIRALDTAPAGDRLRCFLRFWTAKEARMKIFGDGMRLEPASISLSLRDGSPVGYERPGQPPVRLRHVGIGRPDAICCVATADNRDWRPW